MARHYIFKKWMNQPIIIYLPIDKGELLLIRIEGRLHLSGEKKTMAMTAHFSMKAAKT